MVHLQRKGQTNFQFDYEESDLELKVFHLLGLKFNMSGCEFSRLFAPVNIIINSSSLTSAFPAMALIAFFADFIMLSWTPPKCVAKGELKFHLIPSSAPDGTVFSASNFSINSLNFGSSPQNLCHCQITSQLEALFNLSFCKMHLTMNLCPIHMQFLNVLHKKLGM